MRRIESPFGLSEGKHFFRRLLIRFGNPERLGKAITGKMAGIMAWGRNTDGRHDMFSGCIEMLEDDA